MSMRSDSAAPVRERAVDAPIPGRRPLKRKSWFVRHEQLTLPLLTALVIVLIWQLLGELHLWNPLFFSSPSQIWNGLVSLADGTLWSDLLVTGSEFVIGMAIALLVGVPVGIILGTSPRLRVAFDPIINALYSTPIVVLTPLLVIWFGLGASSKIANVAIMAVFPFLINMIEGVQTTDATLLRAARSFGVRGIRVYLEVIFPSAVPFFFTGLRLAIGKGMVAVVVGEYIAATAGIGYRIRSDAESFNTPQYLAGVVVMVFFSVLIMAAVKVVERRAAPWRVLAFDAE